MYTNNAAFAEKVQSFIATLDWEVCPANLAAVSEVQRWSALKMGTTKRKGAARTLNTACQLAHVSLPKWAL